MFLVQLWSIRIIKNCHLITTWLTWHDKSIGFYVCMNSVIQQDQLSKYIAVMFTVYRQQWQLNIFCIRSLNNDTFTTNVSILSCCSRSVCLLSLLPPLRCASDYLQKCNIIHVHVILPHLLTDAFPCFYYETTVK